jgi:hypothetical protein
MNTDMIRLWRFHLNMNTYSRMNMTKIWMQCDTDLVYSIIFEYGKVLISAAGCDEAEGRSIKNPQPTWETDISANGNHSRHRIRYLSGLVDITKLLWC